jgi:hypothetical protein
LPSPSPTNSLFIFHNTTTPPHHCRLFRVATSQTTILNNHNTTNLLSPPNHHPQISNWFIDGKHLLKNHSSIIYFFVGMSVNNSVHKKLHVIVLFNLFNSFYSDGKYLGIYWQYISIININGVNNEKKLVSKDHCKISTKKNFYREFSIVKKI